MIVLSVLPKVNLSNSSIDRTVCCPTTGETEHRRTIVIIIDFLKMRVLPHLCRILLLEAVTLAAPAPEAAVEADHRAPGSSFQGLGRYLRHVLRLETREDIASYGNYGEYGAYGQYGDYGAYPGPETSSTSSKPSPQPSPQPSLKTSLKPTTTRAILTITTSITLSATTTIHPTLLEVRTAGRLTSHETGHSGGAVHA